MRMKLSELKFTVVIDTFDVLLVFLTITATVSVALLIARKILDKG